MGLLTMGLLPPLFGAAAAPTPAPAAATPTASHRAIAAVAVGWRRHLGRDRVGRVGLGGCVRVLTVALDGGARVGVFAARGVVERRVLIDWRVASDAARDLAPAFDGVGVLAERKHAQLEELERFVEVWPLYEARSAEPLVLVRLRESVLHAADTFQAAGVAAWEAQRRTQRAEQFFGDRGSAATRIQLGHGRDGADEQSTEQHGS